MSFSISKTLMAVIFVIALILGLKSFYTVQPGQMGIAVTFGKMNPEPSGEGLGLKLPWTKIYKMSTKSTMDSDKTECFTSDSQVVTVQYSVLSSIPPSKVTTIYREYNYDNNVFKTLISPRIQEVLKQLSSKYRADTILKSRDEIKASAVVQLRKAIGDLIIISDVNITNIDLTDALEKAIEMKTVMEQQALAAKYGVDKAKQDAEAQLIKADADAKAIQMTGEALKQSQSIVFLEAVKKWNGVPPSTLMIGATSSPITAVGSK